MLSMGSKLSCIAKSMEIDKKNAIKLLLLGPGESGKSTIIKQMKILHSNGFTDEDISYYKPIIYSNIITSIISIIRAMDHLKIHFQDDSCQEYKRLLYDIAINRKETTPFNDQTYTALKALWNDMGVKVCFSRSKEYQLSDSTKYFFDNLDRICNSSWVPNNQDILNCRVKTVGLNEIKFFYKKRPFIMVDVGGQRSERSKWVYSFNSTAAVIFCVALSCYDQVCVEDNKTNRMLESLKLWKSVVNNYWFTQATMIIFFNKKDLFNEKITKSSFKYYFSEYEGQNTPEAIIGYIMYRFTKLAKSPKTKTSETFTEKKSDLKDNSSQKLKNKTMESNLEASNNSQPIPESPSTTAKFKNSSDFTLKVHNSSNRTMNNYQRQIYKHITCATDTNNIQFVFFSITDSILSQNLHMSGLI